MIEARTFIMAIIHELRSVLPDANQVDITVHADSTKLTSTTATAIGALFLELINNSLKHAFPNGMKGLLTVSFIVSNNNYIAVFKDDGIGIAQGQAVEGFGTRSVADIARLMGGSLTCQPARQSNMRPGTMWRLVIPATDS
jgi:two-component sensor histidine kinase